MSRPDDVLQSALYLAMTLTAVCVGLAHFILPASYQRQVWLRSIYAISFAAVVGGIGYMGFERWRELYAADPASSTLFAIMAAVVMFGFRDVVIWFTRSLLIRDMAVGDVADLAALTEAGRWRVSIHEAGHALCYGLCSAVPEDAYVCIDNDLNNLVAGGVTIPTPKDPTEMTQERMEWSMLMLLAGAAAERVFFGEGSMNGTGDMDAFNHLATGYLLAGHGEVCVMLPENELDVAANRSAIGRLREHYAIRAENYVRANQATCESLAREIERSEFLDCEQIARQVHNVTLPDDWKLIVWPKSVPTLLTPAFN